MPPIDLNPGSQQKFVQDAEHPYTAYIGGLGSGKTYALVAKAMKFAAQPKAEGQYHGPRVTIAAATYGHLKDTVLPIAEALVNQTGLASWSRDYRKQAKELHIPHNNGIILFRSLDDADKVVRGPELAFIGIDEGRNVSMYDWKLCVGRLRQPGYKRGAAVASTPNGYDWMWDVFHTDSPTRWKGAQWYGAPTMENKHLPPEYVEALAQGYEGRFYQQEVLGEFVGVVEGSVFTDWNPAKHVVPLEYSPELPLYSFWDFGYGDTGVCVFAQVEWKITENPNTTMGPKVRLPWLYIIDAIDAKEWNAKDWAAAYHQWLEPLQLRTAGDFGDPAGRQRNLATGTSVIEDLNAAGVPVEPAQKRPQDYAIRILNNMMAGGRVLVSDKCNPNVSKAFSQHHWSMDENGVKKGVNAVHDWSSHFVDAIRYGATALLSHYARPVEEEDKREYPPGTYGHVFDQLLSRDDEYWMGPKRVKRVRPVVDRIGPR